MRRLALLLMTVPLALVGYGATAASASVASEHLSITIGADGTGPAIATGAINEPTGTYTTLSDHQAGKSPVHHGTFRIDFADGSLFGKYTSIQKSSTFNPTTCTETDKGKGVSILNKQLGTGVFAGAKGTGHFTFVTTITRTVTPTGGCDMSAPTVSTQVEDQGHIKLAS
jgi:hypothetical protein